MAQGIVEAQLEADNRPGLVRSGNLVVNGSDTDGDTRWISGFTFDPDPCGGGHIVDPCQLGSSADTADTTTCTAVGPIQPFIIEATETHSAFDNRPPYYEDRARRKLLGVQSKVLEAEFWSGTKAVSQGWTNNQYLKNLTGLTIVGPAGGAFGIVDSLAALEQAIADGQSWGRAAIHATPRLVTHWISQQLVHAIPNPPGTLMTELGTIVIAGSGYPGTGPQTAINLPHLQYAYATPIPDVRLGAITFNDTNTATPAAVEPATNTRIVRASRFAAVNFSACFRAAVLVNMTTALSQPGS